MKDTPALRAEYDNLFDSCTVRPEHLAEANAILSKIKPHRDRYEAVAAETKVPWHVIAIIHSLEGGLSFGTHLHNGDPLTARTVHVPAGRPTTGHPPFTWEESAADALLYDGMTGWTDWSISGTLYKLERFNGAGYRDHHPEVLSPYLWSYSNHYTKGKYGSDGHFDPNLVSKQCGGAVLLKLMENLAIIGLKTPPAAAAPLALAAAPAPAVVPAPAPAPAAGGYAGQVVSRAEHEHDAYHQYTENDAPLQHQIQRYWEDIGFQFPGVSTAWSAVFVSWIMRTAGAAPGEFKVSTAHSRFVFWAIQNQHNGTGLFRGRRLTEYAPKPGDIIHNNRGGQTLTYDFAAAHEAYESHSAVVVKVDADANGKYALTVGGNESDSVGRKRVALDHNGLVQQRAANPYICVIQNLKA